MTTKVGKKFGTGSANESIVHTDADTRLTPALGESWAHATTTRLILSHSELHGGARECRLVKSPHKAAGIALYSVTENGIRDFSVSHFNDPQAEVSKRPRVQL